MAIPTITSVSPTIGHTGGLGLVEILGTNFQTWTIPPFEGRPSDPAWPTVRVLFGGTPGFHVQVVSSTRLFVRVPRSPLANARPGFGEGTVNVTVLNLTKHGSPIALETATLPNAYTYQRENYSDESVFGRLVRAVVEEFRLQVIPNVSISTHPDFDIETADMQNVVNVAELPALVLFGPAIQENRFYSLNGRVYGFRGPQNYESDRYDAPDTDDLMFTFTGISDQKQEALALQASTRMFFRRNRWFYFDRSPTDKSLGQVRYDLMLDSIGMGYNLPPDQKSSLKSFSGSFTLRGFDWEALAGFDDSDRVERVYQVLSTPAPPTATKVIVSFVFPQGVGVISGSTVTVVVPIGTDLTALTPTIVHNGASISPPSGTPQDFTHPVTYTVTAEDGSQHAYTVTVSHASVSPSVSMGIGTNFWYHSQPPTTGNFSGEQAMSLGIDWSTAYGAGTNGVADTLIWNPTWLAELAPYSALRFMDWGNTNYAGITTWSQRRLPTADNYEAYIDGTSTPPDPGVAYEWMIDLCNRVQKDLWVCIPAKVDSDYWTQLATLIHGKLASGLRVYVEYSNETWNGTFSQFQYTVDQGVAASLPGDDQYRQGQSFAIRQSLGIFQAFQDVWGSDAMGTRVIRVYSYGGDMAITRDAMRLVYTNPTYNPGSQVIDMLAMAPYIGATLNGAASDIRSAFHAEVIAKASTDVAAAVADKAEFGIAALGCYEGGQSLYTNSLTWTTNPYIYDEYRFMLDTWSQHFSLFMHYAHTGRWTNAADKSSWGALDHTGQSAAEAHKYRALVDWKLANP